MLKERCLTVSIPKESPSQQIIKVQYTSRPNRAVLSTIKEFDQISNCEICGGQYQLITKSNHNKSKKHQNTIMNKTISDYLNELLNGVCA